QGWMNQLHVYDPELFHPSLTHSVLATLNGATLKLSQPKSNIPRRAAFEEEILEATFVSHRYYDLTDAKVFLCPHNLARKRTWNKKYPICILFPEAAQPGGSSGEEPDTELPRDEGVKRVLTAGQEAPGDSRERCLYLFGRTGREKEEWYQHLSRASRPAPGSSHGEARAAQGGCSRHRHRLRCHSEPLPCAGAGPAAHSSGSSSAGSTEDIPSAVPPKDLAGRVRQKIFLDYSSYMAQFMPAQGRGSPERSPSHGALHSPTATQPGEDVAGRSELCVAWLNALVGRVFWDFLREQYWADQVSSKIQKKLSKIKLPYFMNELTLTELDMGTSIPSVLSTSSPTINDRGLWVDMEVTYSGSLQMTLETKMNLCKLGKESAAEESSPAEAGAEGARPRLILLADSDAESSSAGSSDEEDVATAEPTGALGVPPPGTEGHVSGNSTSRKILRFVDKIAKSKYFQRATENEFIKKKIEEVSNTPLLLTVELQELAGTLAVNIPPPPTDRVWYSFRVPPQLELKVCPKLGEREVTFLHVTEWIEKKLQHEFQKILVMPNMDDLIIPIMSSGLDP
ncbi:TEX2 protein, partial [Rhinopomastus cyanomelas]|nr:TEX2 protein [Rhinopomastus cyanomelas]